MPSTSFAVICLSHATSTDTGLSVAGPLPAAGASPLDEDALLLGDTDVDDCVLSATPSDWRVSVALSLSAGDKVVDDTSESCTAPSLSLIHI